MQSAMVRTICQVGVFIVCAQALVHFRPERSYEKYLKMLVSIMILFQILQPLAGLINGQGGASLRERAAYFEQQIDESMEAAAKSREQAEQLREQMSLEEVRRRLADRISEPDDAPEADGGSGPDDPADDSAGIVVPVEKIRINVGRGGEADGEASGSEVEEVVPQG